MSLQPNPKYGLPPQDDLEFVTHTFIVATRPKRSISTFLLYQQDDDKVKYKAAKKKAMAKKKEKEAKKKQMKKKKQTTIYVDGKPVELKDLLAGELNKKQIVVHHQPASRQVLLLAAIFLVFVHDYYRLNQSRTL